MGLYLSGDPHWIESFPPLILAGLRHITVGLFLYPILRWKTGIRPTAANWRTAVVTGALLLFIGNGGVSWAEQTVPSGIAALLWPRCRSGW